MLGHQKNTDTWGLGTEESQPSIWFPSRAKTKSVKRDQEPRDGFCEMARKNSYLYACLQKRDIKMFFMILKLFFLILWSCFWLFNQGSTCTIEMV